MANIMYEKDSFWSVDFNVNVKVNYSWKKTNLVLWYGGCYYCTALFSRICTQVLSSFKYPLFGMLKVCYDENL